MAKLAQVTYGTNGDTGQYTYVVNDNVRTGDYIHPSVKHYKSGKIFGTTGIVQSTAKETSKTGQELKQAIENKTDRNGKPIELQRAYTGKEVGAKAEKDASGRFVGGSGLGKTIRNEETGMRQAREGTDFHRSQYIEQTRQANVQRREQQESGQRETFDSYSEPFMKKNNKGE